MPINDVMGWLRPTLKTALMQEMGRRTYGPMAFAEQRFNEQFEAIQKAESVNEAMQCYNAALIAVVETDKHWALWDEMNQARVDYAHMSL
jgi:hypothetical protein